MGSGMGAPDLITVTILGRPLTTKEDVKSGKGN